MTTPMPPMCVACVHLHPDWTCDAFPTGEGIPSAIAFEFFDHRQPFPGDNGIRFQSDNKPGSETIVAVYDQPDLTPPMEQTNESL